MYNQDNYNCMMLIIFFVVASSVGGIVSSIGGTMLGLPFEWSYLIQLPILATGFFLIYRRYPATAWVLAVCVGIIILSTVAILNSLTVKKPSVPEKLAAALGANNLDMSDYETDGISLFGLENLYNYAFFQSDYVINIDESMEFIDTAYYAETRTALTIVFPKFQSEGGLWAFESGQVRASGVMNGVFHAVDSENWINADAVDFDTSADDPMRDVEPYLVVSLPITTLHTNEIIALDASLNITYPESGEVKSQNLTRQVEVFVLPEDFYLFQENYNNWKRAHNVTHSPLWIFLIIGSVISGGVGFAMVRIGALQYRGSGSMIFEVRRISGLRKLGVEAHPLSSMNITDQKGVFIGLVHAQSPAGRAGIRSGDILVHFAGKNVNSPCELNRLSGRLKKGESIQANLLRDGETVDVVVKF